MSSLEAFAIDMMFRAYDGNGALPTNYWAIANGVSDSDRAKQKAAEEWIIDQGWAEKTGRVACMLTYAGRVEVEKRRRQSS